MAARVIVVGVDGSDGSATAVQWCVEQAPRLDARVVVVCALEPTVSMVPPIGLGTLPEYDERQHALLRELLEEWAAPLRDAGIECETRLVDGSPAAELEAIADALDASLIVVGRHGRGGVKEALLGSVPHRLAHHAMRPVVIVPTRPEGTPR